MERSNNSFGDEVDNFCEPPNFRAQIFCRASTLEICKNAEVFWGAKLSPICLWTVKLELDQRQYIKYHWFYISPTHLRAEVHSSLLLETLKL